MTKRMRTYLLAVLGVIILMAGPVAGQSTESADLEAMIAELDRLSQPGPHHQQLKKWVGTWNVEVKMWMEPSASATISSGKSVFKMIFGGRYLIQDFVGQAMGQSFQGMSISGYDNFRGEYFDLWIDEMGTGLTLGRGMFDDSTGTITYRSSMDEPTTGRRDVLVRTVVHFVDANTHLLEMFTVDEHGKEFKNMEITYRREK